MDTVSIDPLALHSLIGSPNAPCLLDVRRDAAFQPDDRMIASTGTNERHAWEPA